MSGMEALVTMDSAAYCDNSIHDVSLHLLDLADEIIMAILRFLPTEALYELAFTCSGFRRLCGDSFLQLVCHLKGPV
jgi:hypothetical protein